jgi:hypothetical protein
LAAMLAAAHDVHNGDRTIADALHNTATSHSFGIDQFHQSHFILV